MGPFKHVFIMHEEFVIMQYFDSFILIIFLINFLVVLKVNRVKGQWVHWLSPGYRVTNPMAGQRTSYSYILLGHRTSYSYILLDKARSISCANSCVSGRSGQFVSRFGFSICMVSISFDETEGMFRLVTESSD